MNPRIVQTYGYGVDSQFQNVYPNTVRFTPMAAISIPAKFTAFRIHRDDAGHRAGLETVALELLTPGEVIVRALWSSVNYKDAR
ncbi:MAG TPA: oxidoreductase, partial [Xylella fastidiosa subsp. pauca]